MNEYGFLIQELKLTGQNKKEASITFKNGLNVVTGPSDTGKTFIFQCINFMLGGSTPPKDIPESGGYDTAQLNIYSYSSQSVFSLTRSLKGDGHFKVLHQGIEKVLAAKHSAKDEDSLSGLLLRLSNFNDKRLRTKKNGTTRSMSFRDVAHLSIISEDDIIKESSPVITEQYISATVEKCAFACLISGEDDSSIVQVEDAKEKKRSNQIKETVSNEFISATAKKIEALGIKNDIEFIRQELKKLDNCILMYNNELNKVRNDIQLLEEERKAHWEKLTKAESRLNVVKELSLRFSLLHDQYQSDINRLDAISESGKRLGEISSDHCPFCGAESCYHNIEKQEHQVDPLAFAIACDSEMLRTKGLIADLELARRDVNNEIGQLEQEIRQTQDQLGIVNAQIKDDLKPNASRIIKQLQECQKGKEILSIGIFMNEQLNEFEGIKHNFMDESSSTNEKTIFAEVGTRYTEAFAKEMEKRLRAWNFPNIDRVVFDLKDYDVLLSGERRTSHGKGVRAITHAAFTLSLLRYCIDNNLPHSKVVVIDSPLVVYKEPETTEEDFSIDVKAAFFTDIAKSFQDAQVIILENEVPPDNIIKDETANIIQFTKTDLGRSGFIPQSKGVDDEQ